MKPKLNAYIKQINSGELKTKKLRVIKALHQSPKTIEHFRTVMGMSHQSVTAVLSILCDEGIVRMTSSSDAKFSLFSLVGNEQEQDYLAKQRRAEKRKLFIERGLKEGFIERDSNNKLIFI
jgi:DNA-binding transcriptional ArsR family regulator